MPKRTNYVSERVTVAFSNQMSNLRLVQVALNNFLWTSEISYGYMLSEVPARFPDLSTPAIDALGHITAEAWYPTNQGRIKMDDTIAKMLERVTFNTVHVYRSVIVFFYSAFESYLDDRLGSLRQSGQKGNWGPFYQSLLIPELINPKTDVRLCSVLRADLCRLIRNRMVHPPFKVPHATSDSDVQNWKDTIKRRLLNTRWPNADKYLINDAVYEVIGKASQGVKKAEQEGKTLPIELFYALFNFTNLDTLAFEIEEALIPPNTHFDGRGTRKKEFVRRTDLIVEATDETD